MKNEAAIKVENEILESLKVEIKKLKKEKEMKTFETDDLEFTIRMTALDFLRNY